MTAKSADDYLKDLVSALERENVEDLVYARRDFLNIMPGDPTFPVNDDERDRQTANIEKLIATFWDNENLLEDLKGIKETNFPELKDWCKRLIIVAESKKTFLSTLNSFPKVSQTSLKFFQQLYIVSEREAANLRKKYLLKLQSNKQLLKSHCQILKELNKTVPEIAALENFDTPARSKFGNFRIFKPSAADNSGNVGCFVLVILWILIRFIIAVSS